MTGGCAHGRRMMEPDQPPVARSRLAIAGTFFLIGFGNATWFTHIPQFRDHLNLSSGVLAVALVAPTVGALVAMQVVGPLTGRFGSRAVARVVSLLLPLALLGVAFVQNLWQAVAVLLVFGAFDGALDVAANTQGVAVERALGRPVLNSMHGAWGIGAILGGATGLVVIALHVSPAWYLTLVAVLLVPLGWLCGRNLLTTPATPAADEPEEQAGTSRARGFAAWRASWTRRIVVLGAIGAAGMLSEGAISNWIGVYLLEHKAASGALAALGYTVFTFTETLTRFAGDRIHARVGAVRLIRSGTVLFAVGLVVTLLSANVWLSIAGLVLVGAGISPINPVAFSAVGHGSQSDEAGTVLGHYTTLSYGGVLGGPAVVGGLAQLVGLPVALACTLVPIGLIAYGAPATRVGLTRRARAPDRYAAGEREDRVVRDATPAR
jgi:MFS family permease